MVDATGGYVILFGYGNCAAGRSYDVDYTGQWDNEFSPAIFNSYMDAANRRGLEIKDTLGYVDSDIEEAVRRGYMIYDK